MWPPEYFPFVTAKLDTCRRSGHAKHLLPGRWGSLNRRIFCQAFFHERRMADYTQSLKATIPSNQVVGAREPHSIRIKRPGFNKPKGLRFPKTARSSWIASRFRVTQNLEVHYTTVDWYVMPKCTSKWLPLQQSNSDTLRIIVHFLI